MAQVLNFESILDNTPSVNTSGYFKELMDSISVYVKNEYSSGRLSGAEYAQVYLGAMQSAMQQAFAFGLQKTVQDAQVALTEAQTAGQIYENTYLKPAQKALIDSQASQVAAEITKIYADKLNTEAQTALIHSQKGEIDYKVSQVYPAQVAVLNKQDDEIQSKIDLVNAQKASELIQATVLNKQAALYEAQTKGFGDKSKIDSAKIIADLLSLQGSLDGTLATGESSTTMYSTLVSKLPA